jgi:hypothetical protein
MYDGASPTFLTGGILFFDYQNLVSFDFLDTLYHTARPANFQVLCGALGAQAKMHTPVACREIAPRRTNSGVWFLLRDGYELKARADAIAGALLPD